MFKKLKQLGPGIMVSAAFIGPGTITTATLAGAGYGYTLLWAIGFSILATIILQEMAARLGVIGLIGVGDAIRKKATNKIFRIVSFVLVISAITLGNAAYEAGNISGALLGIEGINTLNFDLFGLNIWLLLIGFTALILLWMGQYKKLEQTLAFLVAAMGLAFIVCCILLKPDIIAVLKGIFYPQLPDDSLLMVVGLIGTTVVPYNLFLHASSVKQRWKSPKDLVTARWDTIISILLGGFITMTILICSAVAFQGETQTPESMADLSQQLNPILGSWSAYFMGFGFLAAGFTSTVTAPLAAAFATSEIMGWKSDLKTKTFRAIWILVLVSGLVFASLGIKPVNLILIAQVANGLLLPFLASYLLWIMNDKQLVGQHVNRWWINALGLIIIMITLLLGIKSISSALGII
jgi:Mn2+/Fe2+ NRAMP family transporter